MFFYLKLPILPAWAQALSVDQRKNAQTGPIMRKADQSQPDEEGEWINKK